MTTKERRTTCRLDVLDQLNGQILSMNLEIVVRELGAGGFSIESDLQFPIGARHQFCFTTADNLSIILDAVVAHSHRTTPEGHGPRRFTTGFTYVNDPAYDTQRGIDVLLDAMTAVLQFD